MSDHDWQPTATLATLQARAELNQQIRDFFRHRQVLEVETPLLSHGIGTDPNLHPVVAGYQPFPGAAGTPLYLQTSPEFAMKRLLAAGSGALFQLCKAFRNGEVGPRHNPEFTMLEWYRPAFTMEQLMEEVQALADLVLGTGEIPRRTYAGLFMEHLHLQPHTCTQAELEGAVAAHIELSPQSLMRDTCLELLYSHVIEPRLQAPVFVCDYPASQAALAKIAVDEQGHPVARRFELVIRGLELANGYDELIDADEQAQRFRQDQQTRHAAKLPELPGDSRLLAAMTHGLPACAGVALGVDRLLMLKLGLASIDEVLVFPLSRA